jgi:hypothetical protein
LVLKVEPLMKKRVSNSRKVLRANQFRSWKRGFANAISKLFNERTIRFLTENPPDHIVSDDMTWLQNAISSVSAIDLYNIDSILFDALVRRYSHLRCYHGCRPLDLNSYWRDGLRIAKTEELLSVARTRLTGPFCPEVSDIAFQCAVAKSKPYTEGEINFAFCDKAMMNEFGHYALYGSEFITSVAMALPIPLEDPRQLLKRSGTPTVLILDVPLIQIDRGMIEEIGRCMVQQLFCDALNRDHSEDWSGGFAITSNLPSDCIAGHYHPVKIFDPFLHRWVHLGT